MAKREVISISLPAKFHYSMGIKTEQFVFVAGIDADVDFRTGQAIKGIEAQTRYCLETIKEILETGGSSLENVVSTTVYLQHAEDFLKMNEVYTGFFPKDPPARATIPTGLLRPSMLVEIQCISLRPAGQP